MTAERRRVTISAIIVATAALATIATIAAYVQCMHSAQQSAGIARV
ncbi:hypothetical protein ACO0LB_04845 [Undibacterium sp. SXout7W]